MPGSSASAAEVNADSGWSGNGVSGNGVTHSSPPHSISQQPTTMSSSGAPPDSNWSSQPNGNGDPRKLTRWESNPGSNQPMRINPSSTDGGMCDSRLAPTAVYLVHYSSTPHRYASRFNGICLPACSFLSFL